MTILALETARRACSVAVEINGSAVSSITLLRPRSHAERLVPMAVEALRRANVDFSEIDAIAVSAGPGSYTGLRIGVSTAKGLCMSHGARLIGVPTLSAYAHSILSAARAEEWDPDDVAVVLGSRRGEVYFGMYRVPELDAVGQTEILDVEDAAAWIGHAAETATVAVGGDASEMVTAAAGHPARARTVHHLPLATDVAALGRRALEQGKVDDLERFEPYYLKDYIARKPSGTVFDRLQF